MFGIICYFLCLSSWIKTPSKTASGGLLISAKSYLKSFPKDFMCCMHELLKVYHFVKAKTTTLSSPSPPFLSSLAFIISPLSVPSWYNQTQISKYYYPFNAAIKLSLGLNLKCFCGHSPAYKYVHVWLRGQGRRQEPGRHVYFLEETAQQESPTNHVSAQAHSSSHSVTHQSRTIKQGKVSERALTGSGWFAGREAFDGQICRC